MDLSIFLAKVISLYMLVMAIALLKKPSLQTVFEEIVRDRGLRFVLGLFTLIIGAVMVSSHNIWYGGGFTVVITIISWLIFLKGVLVLWMSDEKYEQVAAKFKNKSMLTTAAVVYLVIGLYLGYGGFFF